MGRGIPHYNTFADGRRIEVSWADIERAAGLRAYRVLFFGKFRFFEGGVDNGAGAAGVFVFDIKRDRLVQHRTDVVHELRDFVARDVVDACVVERAFCEGEGDGVRGFEDLYHVFPLS